MEQEADFSEPEQVQLVSPVLAVGSALPSTSSTPSHAADGTGTLPASADGGPLPSSGDGGALPSSGDGPKHVADDKKKVIVKAAPSSAQKALADLRPFLRFADGKDSDVEATKPKAAALPRASSRTPSLSRSRSKSKKEKSEKEMRSKTPRSRSRPVSPGSRDRVVGCIQNFSASQNWLALLMNLTLLRFTTRLILLSPPNLAHPKWKQDFLQWTIDDCRLSWKKGELAWVNLHIGMYFYTPTAKYPLDQFQMHGRM